VTITVDGTTLFFAGSVNVSVILSLCWNQPYM
jgi:hypothetical protein